MSTNIELLEKTLPVAPLKIVAMESCRELGQKVNDYIVSFRQNTINEVSESSLYVNYKSNNYLVDCECPRFGTGEAKGVLRETIRGTDLFIMTDVCNYSLTYTVSGHLNHMSPDDHYQDLKRIISAATGKAHRINVIMPFLYESRQHKRTKRESLDCALALEELTAMGVSNIITFDAHDPRVQNAIPLSGFDSFSPSYQFMKAIFRAVPDLIPDKDHLMIISPDEGAMHRAVYLSNILGVDMGVAVVAEAEKRGTEYLSVADFVQIPGGGIKGVINGRECIAGNLRLMNESGISDESLETIRDNAANEGKTPLFFAEDGTLIGMIAVADTIKSTSAEAISELKKMGIEVIMLTGDHKKTAEAIRRKVGVDRVISEVLPEDKEAEIRKLQEEGRTVAMVGDGINDAPALARADVGIAIGAGTDVAMEAADIVLMKSDLRDVAGAIELSKATIRNIKENLFWAFFYNIIGIPVAAGCYYASFGLKMNPMVAALAMSFSSVFVVSNALRLRFFKLGRKVKVSADNAHPTKTEDVDQKNKNNTDKNKGENKMKKEMSIEGMMCQNCVRHVMNALKAVDGVEDVAVSLEEKKATVTASEKVTEEALKSAVTGEGYTVVGIKSV